MLVQLISSILISIRSFLELVRRKFSNHSNQESIIIESKRSNSTKIILASEKLNEFFDETNYNEFEATIQIETLQEEDNSKCKRLNQHILTISDLGQDVDWKDAERSCENVVNLD